jgi:hypothetical protein
MQLLSFLRSNRRHLVHSRVQVFQFGGTLFLLVAPGMLNLEASSVLGPHALLKADGPVERFP